MQQRLTDLGFSKIKTNLPFSEVNPFGSRQGSESPTHQRVKEQMNVNPFEDDIVYIQQRNKKIEEQPKKVTVVSPLSQVTQGFQPLGSPKVTQSIPPIQNFSQPKDKEGNRLLYKYPNIPMVGNYYLLVGDSDRSSEAHLIQFDGAANPNPGPASSGAVLWSPVGSDGKRSILFESGKYLGKATNNIAEVQGLLLGLQMAAARGVRELLIEGDSELIVFQQIGRYQVKDKNLKVWWSNIQAAFMDEASFDWIAIRQVKREFNERADSITKEVLGTRSSFNR